MSITCDDDDAQQLQRDREHDTEGWTATQPLLTCTVCESRFINRQEGDDCPKGDNGILYYEDK